MADYTTPYPGRPAFYLRLSVTGQLGNMSWSLWAVNPNRLSSTFDLTSRPWTVWIGPQNYQGSSALDFRGGQAEILLGSGPTSGSGQIGVSAAHSGGIFGNPSLSGSYDAGQSIVPPNATQNGVMTEVAQTTMNYRFGYGGGRVLTYEAQFAPTPEALEGSWIYNAGDGLFTLTGLTPGQTYYARSRGTNEAGAGPWGALASATTIPLEPPGVSVAPSLSGTQAVITLTPPGGISGVQSYTVERRLLSGGASTAQTGATPMTVTDLTPGTAYEWRARANYSGSVVSPWSTWTTVFQPNPNTNPGDYFDGNTPDTADLDFGWVSTANNSISRANGLHPTGWADFIQASATSGGTGACYRVTGAVATYPQGQAAGAFSARYSFFSDATAAGFRAGLDDAIGAEVNEGGTYFGSIFARPSREQRLAASISWYDSLGVLLSRTVGPAQVVAAGATVRLVHSGIAPEDGTATVEAIDVAGAGWSLWLGGQTITVDGAMITVGSQFPYFDGNTPDTAAYAYDWEAAVNASPSFRTTLDVTTEDPLADPDCPPPPAPPTAPVITDECIGEGDQWRRYWVQVPAGEVAKWIATIPTLTLTTGAQAAREVRIRVYENPDQLPPSLFQPGAIEAEQIIRFIPPNTTMVLDGVTERARASVNGASWVAADHLLYGTGGAPATWPILTCGGAYLISLDVPLDAVLGNLAAALALTPRML